MKIGICYTSTTPELIDLVNQELTGNIGPGAEYQSYQDPTILSEVRDSHYVTPGAAARLMGMYVSAINDGADVILNVCSSVGEVADSAQDFARFTGIPVVRIDEEMCRDAVRHGTRIGVMATLSSTLKPTKNTLRRVAREMNKRIVLIDGLIDGAFGLTPEKFSAVMSAKAKELAPDVDVLLFAQGSMAYCEQQIAGETGKYTVSSPRFGAAEVKKALQAKGLLKN